MNRRTDEELKALLLLSNKATPGPHQARFIYRMIRAVRLHATTLGLMLQPDDTRDWADAELWAESANALSDIILDLQASRERERELVEALKVAEQRFRTLAMGTADGEWPDKSAARATHDIARMGEDDCRVARAEAKEEQP